jgi:peptide deformylase
MTEHDDIKMTRYPAAVLGKPAKPVGEINDDIRELAAKMIDIMVETHGVGLAGPQAGVNLRIFVFSHDATRENARVYINPEIETSGGLEANYEGCLSLPGIEAKIKRFKKCTITATDLEGNRFTEEADGIEIRGFQHECDHLDGMLIKDRMGQAQKIGARKHLRKLQEDYEQQE